MSPPLMKVRKLSSSIAGTTPREHDNDPSSPSLSWLPEEIVLQCLLHVPKTYDLNLSYVSKTLRFLVRSPELHRLRSFLPKNSIYVFFRKKDAPDTTDKYSFTLLPIQLSEPEIKYKLLPVNLPSHPFMYHSSAVAVGSEIFFVGGSFEPSSDLWILDTRSGEIAQGPSMKVARTCDSVVGVISGKIYVIGGCVDKIQVEVYDPKRRSWKVGESPGERRFQRGLIKQLSASLEWKIYSADTGGINVYNARQGRRLETVKMPSDVIWCMCVVADLLYAYYFRDGLMWLDAKRKIWKRVVGVGCNDVKTLDVNFHDAVMAEYNGKLAVLWPESDPLARTKTEIRCALIELNWVGDGMRGRIEWCGTVAEVPYGNSLISQTLQEKSANSEDYFREHESSVNLLCRSEELPRNK
ncbi:unnamed protein product [Eruca vesicaria subsp. sativa]|uniref:F-box domain-containing protein n=1 Tax=Eruca vesicaria subsp. sativa TaxID=29727 RepID=A0ABC8L5F5_ERUVS|nr:unnamed protein product [Eruca vesicaria subsp. sativa]